MKQLGPFYVDVALSVLQLKKHKPETKAAVAMAVKNAKCSQLFALLVEKKLLFLSNRLATNLYIAASVLYPANVTTGKSLIVETFPGSRASLGGFFLLPGEKVLLLNAKAVKDPRTLIYVKNVQGSYII